MEHQIPIRAQNYIRELDYSKCILILLKISLKSQDRKYTKLHARSEG